MNILHKPIITVFAVLRLVTDRLTDGIGLAKGSSFIGRQTVELCTEIDHWFIQQSIATVHCSKERATIGLCWSDFFYFPFNAKIGNAAAIAGDFDDSGVVASNAAYVSSWSLLLLLSSVSHSACMWAPMVWSGSLSPGTACKLRCRSSIRFVV